MRRRRKLNQTGRAPLPLVLATCLGCGKRFFGEAAFVRDGRGWCTRDCRAEHNRAV